MSDFAFQGTMGPSRTNYGYPDPWSDVASQFMPESVVQSNRHCEYICSSQGEYTSALKRVLSYFVTRAEISGCSDEVRIKYQEFLEDTLGIYKYLHSCGLDFLVYGNSFISLQIPFKRYLSCPTCHLEFPLRVVYENPKFKFEWLDFEFNAHCPKCNKTQTWKHIDRRGETKDIKLKRWSNHEIEILNDDYSDKRRYIWKPPADYKKLITDGKLFHLENAQWEIIEAIRDDQYFEFDDGVILHLYEEPLAGIRAKGFGISRVLSNFRSAYLTQVYKRYNEAIALDYIVPFRVLTPAPGPGGQNAEARDPVFNFGMAGFVGRVSKMIKRRRMDPAMWHVLPFPIDYKALGGDAKAFAPKELLDQSIEMLLNNIGIPVELFKGTLQLQTAQPALRLFESNWSFLPYNLNLVLKFVCEKLSKLLQWQPCKAKLESVGLVDDLNKSQAKLQLMTGGQLSQSTGLKSIGEDWKEEIRRKIMEEKYQSKLEQEMQSDMEDEGFQQQLAPSPEQSLQMQQQQGQQQQGGQGGGGQGDDPNQMQQAPPNPVQEALANMPQGTNTPITPTDLLQEAQSLASKLIQLPETAKDSQLRTLKQSKPVLHSLVRSAMDRMRIQLKQNPQQQPGQ